MAPTSVDPMLVAPASFPANHDVYPDPFAKAGRSHHTPYNSSPQPRENQELSTPTNTDFTPTEYAAGAALHASIVSQPTIYQTVVASSVAADASTSRRDIRSTEIALIVAGVGFTLLLGFGMVVVQIRKPNFFPGCFRRCRRTRKLKFRKATSISQSNDKKGILIKTIDDCDDLTWGTPTRILHFESTFNGGHFNQDPAETPHRDLLLYSPPMESVPGPVNTLILPGTEDRSHTGEETFQRRLHVEEEDIASALAIALRDFMVSSTNSNQMSDGAVEDGKTQQEDKAVCSLVAVGGDTAVPRGFLYDNPGVMEGDTSTLTSKARQRQRSDASASSQETSLSQIIGCFSPTDSSSSISSISNNGSHLDPSDDDEDESTYELKRAQTQSLEIKKGVLIAWQCPSLALTNVGMPSKVVISEPYQLDPDQTPGMTCIPEGNISHLGELRTTQTVSSLVREVSLGTLASFSSATQTEGWCIDGEGFLQPPIPHLMVTRPSTSSIFTTDSNGSSISIDLNDFPHPPSLTQPTQLQLTDSISSHKRVWDNHSLNSTVAQKRSTVERFIMMYETGS